MGALHPAINMPRAIKPPRTAKFPSKRELADAVAAVILNIVDLSKMAEVDLTKVSSPPSCARPPEIASL